MAKRKTRIELEQERIKLEEQHESALKKINERIKEADIREGYHRDDKSSEHAKFFLGGVVLEIFNKNWKELDPEKFREIAKSELRRDVWNPAFCNKKRVEKANDAYYRAEGLAKEENKRCYPSWRRDLDIEEKEVPNSDPTAEAEEDDSAFSTIFHVDEHPPASTGK